MMKRLVRCFFAITLAFHAHSASAERIITVEPGLWEYTHSLAIPGLLNPTGTPKTECISAEEATQSLSDLLGDLSDDAGCSVMNLKDTLNTVKFDLSCSRKFERVSLSATGHLAFRYGRTRITGRTTGLISLNGVEMNIVATGIAQRIGRCKK